MEDKNFCMSSYLAFRYIEDPDKNFYKSTKHRNIIPIKDSKRELVSTASDIDKKIKEQFDSLQTYNLGILLSGGMDSAILASYMPGGKAYTFRFLEGEFQKEELERARYYSSVYNLDLHYVDISWETVNQYLGPVLINKGAPVHSIEPQIYQAALQAKYDGVNMMIVGESSDLVFGGMDGLLSKDWTVEEFKQRYTFLDPKIVLREPISMDYLFERYKIDNNKIDFQKFLDEVFSIESSSSYMNAFEAADMKYYDPYAVLKMAEPLNLKRIRSGDTKYLIRELFRMKYPDFPVPDKVPMPRPVDEYFRNWEGPRRLEFRDDIQMEALTGNQKWQLFCLEYFLNMFE